MTTATAPPLLDEPTIPAAELESLLDDRERVCEFYDRDIIPCEQLAAWALTFRELCGCHDSDASLLLACDQCRRQVEDDCQSAQCLTCLRYLPLLRAEPL